MRRIRFLVCAVLIPQIDRINIYIFWWKND